MKLFNFLVNFGFSSAAILDFEKWLFRHFRCLGTVTAMLHAEFGENRMIGLGVIQDFVNFKMAAGGHLGLRISRFWDNRLVLGAELMLRTKFGAYEPFQSYSIFSKCQFLSAAILDFAK